MISHVSFSFHLRSAESKQMSRDIVWRLEVCYLRVELQGTVEATVPSLFSPLTRLGFSAHLLRHREDWEPWVTGPHVHVP